MVAVPFNKQNDITDVALTKDTAHVDIWYPGIDGRHEYLEVGLIHVRAADNIRISYDFARDGWKIEQASIFSWDMDDKVCDADWQEVAFIQAWARERKDQDGS